MELVADCETREAFDPALLVGKRLSMILQREGLISRAMRDTLAFSPPLIIERDDIDEILSIVSRGLDELADDLQAQGQWSPP